MIQNKNQRAINLSLIIKRLSDDLNCNLSFLSDYFDSLEKKQQMSLITKLKTLSQNINFVTDYLSCNKENRVNFNLASEDKVLITHENNKIIIEIL